MGAGGIPINGNGITRNLDAKVFLPSENEWYKAAYFNPATSSYFQYPTSSNTFPTWAGPTATPNTANYNDVAATLVTDVGAYSGTTSPYGAFDMGGNVWQWNESLIDGSFRGLRGGSFDSVSLNLMSAYRYYFGPTSEDFDFGFRVASIPEPSTIVLAALGVFALLAYRRRRSVKSRAWCVLIESR